MEFKFHKNQSYDMWKETTLMSFLGDQVIKATRRHM